MNPLVCGCPQSSLLRPRGASSFEVADGGTVLSWVYPSGKLDFAIGTPIPVDVKVGEQAIFVQPQRGQLVAALPTQIGENGIESNVRLYPSEKAQMYEEALVRFLPSARAGQHINAAQKLPINVETDQVQPLVAFWLSPRLDHTTLKTDKPESSCGKGITYHLAATAFAKHPAQNAAVLRDDTGAPVSASLSEVAAFAVEVSTKLENGQEKIDRALLDKRYVERFGIGYTEICKQGVHLSADDNMREQQIKIWPITATGQVGAPTSFISPALYAQKNTGKMGRNNDENTALGQQKDIEEMIKVISSPWGQIQDESPFFPQTFDLWRDDLRSAAGLWVFACLIVVVIAALALRILRPQRRQAAILACPSCAMRVPVDLTSERGDGAFCPRCGEVMKRS